jgi:DNA (cytosine-5)-methyltransferase 1
MESAPSIYNVTEAARLLNISAQTLVRYEKQGKLPAARRSLSGARFYDGQDIERLRQALYPPMATAV